MTNRPRNLPPSPNELAEEKRVHRDKGEGPKHIVDTGLPPGITVDEAIDPGKNTPTSDEEGRNAR